MSLRQKWPDCEDRKGYDRVIETVSLVSNGNFYKLK